VTAFVWQQLGKQTHDAQQWFQEPDQGMELGIPTPPSLGAVQDLSISALEVLDIGQLLMDDHVYHCALNITRSKPGWPCLTKLSMRAARRREAEGCIERADEELACARYSASFELP
jgi:hypothetical protein